MTSVTKSNVSGLSRSGSVTMLESMRRHSAWRWLPDPHLPTFTPRMYLKGLVFPTSDCRSEQLSFLTSAKAAAAKSRKDHHGATSYIAIGRRRVSP